MLIKEYRIPFPATLEEYRIGMLYMVARATEEENRRSNGQPTVQLVTRRSFEDEKRGIKGIYTEKYVHTQNFLPSFIKLFLPEQKCILVEKAWNAFPDYCLTTYENRLLGGSFHLSVESRYIGNDRGCVDNALMLSEEELEQREVVDLNIASEEHVNMTADTNVVNFESKVSERSRLDAQGQWITQASPVMCCYKVVRLDVSTKGLPGRRIEQWGQRNAMQAAFVHYNRQVLCWMDQWYGLDISAVDGLCAKRGDSGLLPEAKHGLRPRIEAAATVLATELAAEGTAGLAFSFADQTNPFIT